MAWGRVNESWNHTASLMAILAAIHCDPGSGRPPTAATFHPYMDEPPLPKASPDILRQFGFKPVKPEVPNV